LAFVSSFSNEGTTIPARITEAIIRYARKLPPIVLQIESLCSLGRSWQQSSTRRCCRAFG
jgi:hypothetical protein